MAQERLQKIIAHAGLCSRRQAEKLIQEGVVKVNGVVITALGSKADPTRDRIMVHGKKLIKPSSFDESNDPAISLSNMHYSYLIDNQKTFTVGPFNIDVKKNEVLIIKGGNGSGKIAASRK